MQGTTSHRTALLPGKESEIAQTQKSGVNVTLRPSQCNALFE